MLSIHKLDQPRKWSMYEKGWCAYFLTTGPLQTRHISLVPHGTNQLEFGWVWPWRYRCWVWHCLALGRGGQGEECGHAGSSSPHLQENSCLLLKWKAAPCFFLQVIAQTDVYLLHHDDRRTNGAYRVVVEANQEEPSRLCWGAQSWPMIETHA